MLEENPFRVLMDIVMKENNTIEEEKWEKRVIFVDDVQMVSMEFMLFYCREKSCYWFLAT